MSDKNDSSSKGKPKLIYFDGPGRGNLTRMAFLVGDVEFVDERVTFQDWPTMKSDPNSVPSQLFGSLPVIEHGDDVKLAQSIALPCYAAELGMYSKKDDTAPTTTPQTRAIDIMVVTTNEELKQPMYKCLFGSEESKADAKKVLEDKVTPLLTGLERILTNHEASPMLSKNIEQPSLADLAIFDSVYSPFPGLKQLNVDLTSFPKVVACADAVGNVEKIKSFVDKGFKV